MTKKVSQNSLFFYREPEKRAMGPLPLATLQVAMQAGSLSHSAEVSQDGNEPWVPLAVVLGDPRKAFAHDGLKGVNEEVARCAKESKGISPSVLVVIVSVAIVLGISVVNFLSNPKYAKSSDVTLSSLDNIDANEVDIKANEDKVIMEANLCLHRAQIYIWENNNVQESEVYLSRETSVGESQLQAIKLQKLNSEMDEYLKEYKDRLVKLCSLEDKAKMTGRYSDPLKVFFDYGCNLAHKKGQILKYKSITDPEYSEMYKKLIYLCFNIKLEQVLAGGYKSQSKDTHQ